LKTFTERNVSHILMFTVYNTRITFYLWYIAKIIDNTGMLKPESTAFQLGL